MNKRSVLYNRLINLTLTIAVSLISLFVLEIMVRSLPLAERIGWDRVPSLSMREKKFNPAQGKIKIVALGDSFVAWRAGEGVNMFDYAQKTFSDGGSAILNLGWPGIDIDSYVWIYKKYVHFEPDYVVMCVYLGNDVRNYPAYDDLDKASPPDRSKRFKEDWKLFFKKHSSLFDLIFRYGRTKLPFMRSGSFEKNLEALQTGEGAISGEFIQARMKQMDPQMLEWAKGDAVNPWLPAIGIAYPNYYKNLFALRSPQALRAAEETVDIIKEFYTKEKIKNLLVVLIPESLQVSESYDDFFKRCGFYLEDFPLQERRKLTDYMETKLTEAGIKVLDVTSVLEKYNDVYMVSDTHLNAKGHKSVGELIAAALENDFKSESIIL